MGILIFRGTEAVAVFPARRNPLPTSGDNVCVSSELIVPLLTPSLQPEKQADRRGSRSDSMLGLFERLSKGATERRAFRERRASPRVSVELECEERTEQSRYVRLTSDLSTFGMSTRQGHTPARGTRLTLSLFLPDEPLAPLKLDAEVLGPYDGSGGMRLKFKNPTVEAIKRIHRYLAAIRD